MSVFTALSIPYSNHIGGGFTHPVTGAVYFLCTFRPNSAGSYWLQVWQDDAPYGNPQVIRQWQTGTPEAGPGPWGYGTCTWLPNGSLFIAAPGGVDTSAVVPSFHIEPNLFPPIPLGAGGGVPGPAGPQGPQGVPGPQGPAGPAGSGSGGTLSARYTEALERLCAWLGIA